MTASRARDLRLRFPLDSFRRLQLADYLKSPIVEDVAAVCSETPSFWKRAGLAGEFWRPISAGRRSDWVEGSRHGGPIRIGA